MEVKGGFAFKFDQFQKASKMGKDSPKPVRCIVCACVYFLVPSKMMININDIKQKWNKQSQRDIKIVCLPFLCFHHILKIVTITIWDQAEF